MRQRLHGFAQSHVVGEDAAKIGAAQELQPVDAACLVVAQRTLERFRNDRLGDRSACLTQLPAKRKQRFATFEVEPGAFFQFGEIGGIEAGKADTLAIDAKAAASIKL